MTTSYMQNLKKSRNADTHCYLWNMEQEIRFWEWLGDRIKDAKQTQSSLASLIDVSPSAVSQWVNGVQRPRRRTLRKIATVLGFDVNEALAILAMLQRAVMASSRAD